METRISIEGLTGPHPSGYKWIDATILMDPVSSWRGPLLIAIDPESTRSWGSVKLESSLFREFASMPLEQNAALEFANRYGLLTLLEHYGRADDGAGGLGDPWFEWVRHVTLMRVCVEFWDLANDRDSKGVASLAESLPRNDGGEPRSANDVLSQPDILIDAERMMGAAPRDRISLAREFVTNNVSGKVADMHMGAIFDGTTQSSRLIVHGRGMASLLWWQFAAAVCENKQFRKCLTCGKQFELSPSINRISRHYCKNACKVAAFRQRKVDARKLKDRGHTLKQIAERLDSEVSIVRGWLKEPKPPKR